MSSKDPCLPSVAASPDTACVSETKHVGSRPTPCNAAAGPSARLALLPGKAPIYTSLHLSCRSWSAIELFLPRFSQEKSKQTHPPPTPSVGIRSHPLPPCTLARSVACGGTADLHLLTTHGVCGAWRWTSLASARGANALCTRVTSPAPRRLPMEMTLSPLLPQLPALHHRRSS